MTLERRDTNVYFTWNVLRFTKIKMLQLLTPGYNIYNFYSYKSIYLCNMF